MGIIREPINVDFVVDSRPLTKTEEKKISDFILEDKAKRVEGGIKKLKKGSVKARQPA